MTQATVTTFPCPRCGTLLYAGTLVCPNCAGFVYAQRLNELATEAMRAEPLNPLAAARIWRECLGMLPPESEQYRVVQERVGALVSGSGVAPLNAQTPPVARRNDSLPVALTKTIVSMLISIVVYSFFFSEDRLVGLVLATVFVVLILIHEMGHVIAMRFYGLKAGPPIFIPFLGALINMREKPKDALEEAVVGIGGPVLGTIGAIACYAIYLKTGWPILLPLAFMGFMINFFNMIPVPPLDGGRITAAVSPWIWVPGLLALAGLLVRDWVVGNRINYILILVLVYAWPRVKQTLIGRDRDNPYYKIGLPAMWGMGAAYVGLALVLAFFAYRTGTESGLMRMFR